MEKFSTYEFTVADVLRAMNKMYSGFPRVHTINSLECGCQKIRSLEFDTKVEIKTFYTHVPLSRRKTS